MKARQLIIAVFLASACVMRAATNDLTALLQKGLFEEEANHNLEAAMQAYQTAIAEHDKDRKLVATAVFRLGECFKKQGKTNEAAVQYQRVMREYSEQDVLVKMSAANLGGRVPQTGAMSSVSESTPELRALETSYQELAPKALAARSLLERIKSLNGSAEQERFFTIIRPDQSLIALEETKANRETKFRGTANDFGKESQEYKKAEIELKTSAEQVAARVEALIWAAINDAKSLSDQEAELRKQIADLRGASVANKPVRADLQNLRVSPPDSTAEEDEEIRRIKVLVQNSPDLINAGEPTPLQKAAEKGHLRVAEFLLANGAEVDARGRGPATPLFGAAWAGHRTMVELLLAKGANPNALGPKYNMGVDKSTPLHEAVHRGFKSVVEVLLAHKANVNAKDSVEKRPLHYAAETGNNDIFQMLISAGAEVEVKDAHGETPLTVAAQKGQVEMAQVLMAHKANVNVPGEKRFTPLHWAVGSGKIELVKALLAAGADVNARGWVDNSTGPTPLTWAIDRQDLEMVQLLLEHHADPNFNFAWRQVNSNGSQSSRNNFTPLLMAINHCKQEPRIVEALLAHGADPNAKGDGNNCIPLFQAIEQDQNEMLEMLIRHNVNINVVVNGRQTALITAGWGNRTGDKSQAVEILCKAGADINANENLADTALHDAVRILDAKMAKLLIAHQANVNALNGSGTPPLGYTRPGPNDSAETQTSKRELADLLIKAGADVNYERETQIAVKPASAANVTALFYKGTNAFNHPTLAELIAQTYCIPRRDAGNAEINGSFGLIPFPDFANVSTSRLQPDGTFKSIPVNATGLLQSGDASQDMELQWGDIVSIPELDHPVGEAWKQLPKEQFLALAKYLSRRVEVTVKGQRNTVLLTPYLVSSKSSLAALGHEYLYDLRRETTNIVVCGFELGNFLTQSGLLRVSSDLSRIKVTHRLPDGSSRELTINETPGLVNYRYDLWLRDGDVIEIPERDPNAPAPEAANPPQPGPRQGIPLPAPGGPITPGARAPRP